MSFTRVDKISKLSEEHIGQKVELYGWVYGSRKQGEGGILSFIDLNDGTLILDPVRIVAHKPSSSEDIVYSGDHEGSLPYESLCDAQHLCVGSSVRVLGQVVKAPEGKSQKFEVKALDVIMIDGVVDPENPPIKKSQKKNFTSLRQDYHGRFRADLIRAIMKIRSEALFAVHEFFHREEVQILDPNIMTSSDCEGAGEMFTVTPQFFSTKAIKYLEKVEKGEVTTEEDKNFAKVGLTVSSQLPLEAISMGTNSVYTCQKSFRAEKSDTTKHLAEFLHVEYERYFITLDTLLDFTERFVKYLIKTVLERCKESYTFMNDTRKSPGELKDHDRFLQGMLEKKFVRIKHSDAIDLMQKDLKDKVKHIGPSGKLVRLKFKVYPKHGEDLGSEHEKYLVEKFGTFVFVTHWPSKIKSFYMKQKDDGTCESFDLLAPIVGEMFGGSMREYRYETLKSVMEDRNMSMAEDSPLKWFVDLRKNGSAPHGGWGMGFDRLAMFLVNAPSIRDIVPYSVYYGHCKY